MTFLMSVRKMTLWARIFGIGMAALALASCASLNTKTTTSSHPTQELDASGQPIIEAGDIAIAGQLVSHSIMELPEVADAEKPPLVRFSGVTSVVNGPVDTSIYTGLLRDRLLLLTREKLRFVERQLPPLGSHKIKHNKELGGPIDVDTDADYRITAELFGNFSDDTYRIEIRFVDLHSSLTLFSGDYKIRKEQEDSATGTTEAPSQQIESTDPTPIDVDAPPPRPSQSIPGGNSGLQ